MAHLTPSIAKDPIKNTTSTSENKEVDLIPEYTTKVLSFGKGGKSKSKAGKIERSSSFKASGPSSSTWNALAQTRPCLKPPRLDNHPYPVIQTGYNNSALVTSTTLPTFVGAAFSVGLLDQISSLTALFDQYRITLIEVWLSPVIGSASNQPGGELATVIDYDDATALTTFGQAMDYQNAVIASANCGHYRKFVPHAAAAVYSGTFTSYENVESPWIDAASTAVYHYGMKAAATVTATTVTFDMVYRLTTQWRNLR